MKLNIEKSRKREKMSIRQLSKISGVSRGYLSELESDIYSNPSIRVLCKIKKALGCVLDDLVICDEEVKAPNGL